MQENRDNIVKEAADKLMEMFKTGMMPEKVAFSVIRRKIGGSRPSDKWSIGNKIIMYCYGTDDARGYKQWLSAKRFVKKGSKCIYIFSPKTKKIVDEQTQEEKVIIYGFKATPVFKAEDTEGEDLFEEEYTPPVLPPLFEVSEKLGVGVTYSPIYMPALGSYSLTSNQIKLHSQDAFVYFHELSHAVHHSFTNLKEVDDARAETVAELSACVLCQIEDIHGYENQAYKYVKSYCKDKKPDAVLKYMMSVLNEVEQVVRKILEVAEETS